MKVYKLFRVKNGKLYPLYVESDREIEMGTWVEAHIGQLIDETHVKASGCGGRLALRPGFHSTRIPWTDWIGQKLADGTLVQREDTVWCECEVEGNELNVTARYGLKSIPNGYYFFKMNSKQRDPWIISDKIKVNRRLSYREVSEVCMFNGLKPQPLISTLRAEYDAKYQIPRTYQKEEGWTDDWHYTELETPKENKIYYCIHYGLNSDYYNYTYMAWAYGHWWAYAGYGEKWLLIRGERREYMKPFAWVTVPDLYYRTDPSYQFLCEHFVTKEDWEYEERINDIRRKHDKIEEAIR